MKHLRLTLGAAVLLAGACASEQPKTAATAPQQPAAQNAEPMDMATMMAKMQELGTPGAKHAELLKGVGKWDNTFQMRMEPEGPWMEVKGTMTAHALLDRYLVEESEFSFMDMPMKGINIVGYDNMTGEYTSMWTDSMSTWWVTSRGKERADGVIEFRGTMKDVAGERPFRMEIKHVGPDQVDMVLYDTIPPKGEVEMMRMTSKRT